MAEVARRCTLELAAHAQSRRALIRDLERETPERRLHSGPQDDPSSGVSSVVIRPTGTPTLPQLPLHNPPHTHRQPHSLLMSSHSHTSFESETTRRIQPTPEKSLLVNSRPPDAIKSHYMSVRCMYKCIWRWSTPPHSH